MSRPSQLDAPEMAVRYLGDKLSSAEREAFEAHYLVHPKVVEEMELDAKLKAGLMCIRDAGELDQLTIASKRRWFVTPIAIAASLLVAAVAVLSFRYVASEAVLASSTAALSRPLGSQLALGATYPLLPTRTSRYDAVIPLPQSPRAIRLQVVLDIDPPVPAVGVTLTAVGADASRTNLAVLHQLHADENGVITLYLNSAAVRPGTYELSVSRETAPVAAPEGRFILEVTSGKDSPPTRPP